MKIVFLILLTFFIGINTFAQQNKEKIEDALQTKATHAFKQLKIDNLDSFYTYIEPRYLNKNKIVLKNDLTTFYNEFKKLAPSSKFYFTRIWPKGNITFQFSYIDSTGVALQIELSFKENDINSKIVFVETKNRAMLKKEREGSSEKPNIIIDGFKETYPYYTTLLLKNCNKDNRIMTFISPVNFFRSWVRGAYKLEKNKVLDFSSSYKLDSSFLRANIIELRKTLPKKFWSSPMLGLDRDNQPNEEAIFFTELFIQVDKKQKVKIFSGYKITFEGNDASVDAYRRDPKIKNIEFIFDNEVLKNLEKQINNDLP